MAVFDTKQDTKQSQSSSHSGGGGGNGKDDPVKAAAQAIVAYADDPAMLGPNQYLRDLVEGLRKALAAQEGKK